MTEISQSYRITSSAGSNLLVGDDALDRVLCLVRTYLEMGEDISVAIEKAPTPNPPTDMPALNEVDRLNAEVSRLREETERLKDRLRQTMEIILRSLPGGKKRIRDELNNKEEK